MQASKINERKERKERKGRKREEREKMRVPGHTSNLRSINHNNFD